MSFSEGNLAFDAIDFRRLAAAEVFNEYLLNQSTLTDLTLTGLGFFRPKISFKVRSRSLAGC